MNAGNVVFIRFFSGGKMSSVGTLFLVGVSLFIEKTILKFNLSPLKLKLN